MASTQQVPYRPQPNDEAWDTVRECPVTVKTAPGVYGTGEVWVRPLDGTPGWLAACDGLTPLEEGQQ